MNINMKIEVVNETKEVEVDVSCIISDIEIESKSIATDVNVMNIPISDIDISNEILVFCLNNIYAGYTNGFRVTKESNDLGCLSLYFNIKTKKLRLQFINSIEKRITLYQIFYSNANANSNYDIQVTSNDYNFFVTWKNTDYTRLVNNNNKNNKNNSKSKSKEKSIQRRYALKDNRDDLAVNHGKKLQWYAQFTIENNDDDDHLMVWKTWQGNVGKFSNNNLNKDNVDQYI